jgi:glycerate 2-kinase
LAPAEGAGADDAVLCLISGGGSALLSLPLDGLTLSDKQAVNRSLLACGATIAEMNCVRRHLSAIKGGRLTAAAYPTKVTTLLISDVPGDNPRDIASGPTVADDTTSTDALEIVERYGVDAPPAVGAALAGGRGETVKPENPRIAGAEARVIATPQMALEAAAKAARAVGLPVHILSDSIEGQARDVGKAMVGIVRQIALHQQPFAAPCVLLSGRETTVTVRGRGRGRGGRNVEFLLSLGLALDGLKNVWAIAGDTGGVDGTEKIAAQS